MVYSQSLLARRGPLAAIWVAAYCFKKLKKAQITTTDISASVDKILKDEWDGVAYRVLAYLLLGVVRIYSRKVEYLFDNCNEALIEIKKFVAGTEKDKERGEVLRAFQSVIVPDSFELDAFDMGSLEDISSEHLASRKEITLKDCADWNAVGQLASEMYDHVEFGACHSIFSTYYDPVRNLLPSLLPSHAMDYDMELRASSNGADSEEIVEKIQCNRFSSEECADIVTFFGTEKEPENQVELYNEDIEENGELIKTPDIAVRPVTEDGTRGEGHEIFYGYDRELSCHVISTGEDHQSDREEIMEIELAQPENQTFQVTPEEHSLRNLRADMESLKNGSSSEESFYQFNGLDVLSGAKLPQEAVCSHEEENLNNDGEPTKSEDLNAPDGEKTIPREDRDRDPHSMACDESPEAKQPDALAVTTPKLKVAPRPATKESARNSKKRKCVFDEIVVLPSEVIRQSIHDASDLVAKRRKVPKDALAVWKTRRIGNLAHNFMEPLISNISQELRSVLCKRKLKKLKITPERLTFLDCPRRTGMSEQTDNVIESLETVEPPENSDVLEYPCTGGSHQTQIAPDTPVLHSKSMKSFHSPKSPEVPYMDIAKPETSGRTDNESSSMRANQTFPSDSVICLDGDEDHDFNLLNEEIDSREGVDPESDGWSVRTRKVAKYLNSHFSICKSRGEQDVNLLEVAKRKTKKESARLFYETLVLKTVGFVDVKQADPYGDILIRKLPKWNRTWEGETINVDTSS